MKREHREPGDVVAFEEWWPSLIDATHAIISGGKGSGKTTLVRAVMLELARQGAQFVLIDPHHKRGEWGPGITPLAAGRRFEQARVAFAWGNHELDRRYKLRADEAQEDFPLVVFVVDEFDLFTDKRPDVSDDLRELAARFLSMIGDESRKVGIRLIVIAHGTEVKNLGLEGRGKKRTNYTIVELQQGPDQQPEPTGMLRVGSTVWTIDTRPVLDLAVGELRPEMLVALPQAEVAENTSTDPIVLQRRIATLEQQMRARPSGENPAQKRDQSDLLATARQQIATLQQQLAARPEPETITIEVPVFAAGELDRLATIAEQIGALSSDLQQTAQALLRAAQRAQEPCPEATAYPAQDRPEPAPVDSPALPMVEIDIALAIPEVARRIKYVQQQLARDSAAQGYVMSMFRLLWDRTLRPEAIAEGKGTVSRATLSRRRAVCRALVAVQLLVDTGAAGYTVNHREIQRLWKLTQSIS